jgi:hypothetical protein
LRAVSREAWSSSTLTFNCT